MYMYVYIIKYICTVYVQCIKLSNSSLHVLGEVSIDFILQTSLYVYVYICIYRYTHTRTYVCLQNK